MRYGPYPVRNEWVIDSPVGFIFGVGLNLPLGAWKSAGNDGYINDYQLSPFGGV